jgi:hypothetical protein
LSDSLLDGEIGRLFVEIGVQQKGFVKRKVQVGGIFLIVQPRVAIVNAPGGNPLVALDVSRHRRADPEPNLGCGLGEEEVVRA